MESARPSALWAASCLAIAAGLALAFLPHDPSAGALLATGLGALALHGLLAAARRARAAGRRRNAPLFAGAGLLALAGGAVALALPGSAVAVAAASMGAQALLAALGHDLAPKGGRLRRHALRYLGHGLVALGAALTLATGAPFTPSAGFALVGGFSLLALHAHWAQRRADPHASEGWEALLLAAVVVALSAMTLVYAGTVGLAPYVPGETVAPLVALVAGVGALALLCAPPRAPAALRSRAGIALDVLAHGGAAIALLNILFLGFSLVSGWSLKVVFAVLFGWQLLVIGVEYRTVRHAERRRRRPTPHVAVRAARLEPVTVVVPAANEAAVLPESLERNLAVDYPLRFVLVPATKSTDETVAVARAWARRHPGRVRVVEGTSGSKAEDLNHAWRTIDTRYVLMLDADETIDRESILRALAIMEAHHDVGLVQGRKVSRAPEDGWLARFISAERRYSTWMDHVMHGEDLGSAHFGGSAAMLRRVVPEAVGGWTDQTMTEDIEFTLRMHLADAWRIVYAPEMVVREADPVSFGDLLKQRTRWARGWAQCFALYFPRVVEARRRLGAKRAFGLTLLLLIALSALWTTFVPATLLMRFSGISPLMPVMVAIPLSLVLLPSRLLAYGYAAFRDPVIPLKATPGRIAELALHAYLWILLGWFVQLHALYLELSSSPRVWYVTGKRSARGTGAA